MRILNKYNILLAILIASSLVYSKPREGGNVLPDIYPPRNPVPNVVIQQVLMDGNNISSWYYNSGIFNQDFRYTNTPGLMWPKGNNTFACFTAGLSIGAYVNNILLEAMCSYKGEYAPGYIDNSSGIPQVITDSRFRIYKVTADDMRTAADWQEWGNMVPFGAPFVDVDNDGQYNPEVDVPGMKDAVITLFGCLTDGFLAEHKIGEGFGGGTAPLFVEMHFTAWCYSATGLEDIQFLKFVVINKNVLPWQRTYMGVTVDPDLGGANDDYIGCDTSLNMGFCYNGDDDDEEAPYNYGVHPPAFGMDYFRSPVNKSVFPPEPLGLTSFVYFTNNSAGGPVCERDPNGEAVPAYYMLQGLKKDQTPWVIPPGGSTSLITKYTYPGDPETGSGWTEGTPGGVITGSVENCGGPNVLTGTVRPINQPGDRRFIFNSGSEDFQVNPNDTQTIILAQFVARSSSNFASVTKLKKVDRVAQRIYDNDFRVIPPPPKPKVNVSIQQTSTTGTCNLTFAWGDTSEFYHFQDTIFQDPQDSSYYIFEGYEVYEIDNTLSDLPNFNDPSTIDDRYIKLITLFDKINNIGYIMDTFSTGVTINGIEQFATLPIVPPYKMVAPANFPNTGISRSLTLTSTSYPSNHGGRTEFIYGHTYKFAILAYAYNTNPNPQFKGMNSNRNTLASCLITVTPEATLAGTQYSYSVGDTLNTSRRDLGVMPIVKAPEMMRSAIYKVVFNNNPDTTYNLYRNDTLLKSNLKASNNLKTTAEDSARIFDGMLFKVYRIKFETAGGLYTGNAGVVKDPTLPPDSIQTKQNGWEYNPPQNCNLEGGRFIITGSFRPWQSASMGLSYPTRATYTGFRSLLNPEDLRKVKIVFTGYGNGSMAYRYKVVTAVNFQYQDMKEVPFKVYEVEPYDGSPDPRQLNVAFLEADTGNIDGKWEPTTDSSGGKDILYIFGSDYDPNPNSFYTAKNLLLLQPQIDIMYTWNAKLRIQGPAFTNNDELIIYPYTVTRSEFAPGYPLFYELSTNAPIIGNPSIAALNNDLNKITIVPNPYYGFNSLETPTTGNFITFRRLPKQCSIKIYTLNGDLIKTLEKNDNNSTLQWNMTNLENVPIASGIYICLIDAPGIGTKVLKAAIFTAEERIDF